MRVEVRARTASQVWANVRSPGVAPPGVPLFTAVMLGGTLLLITVLIWLGVEQHVNAAWHFYESRVGTYYSGLLLVTCAALAFAVARVPPRRVARFWLVAGAGFLFLALDEMTLIHEGIDKWIHARLGWRDDDPLTDHIDDAIVILYGAVALVWGFRYRATLLRLRWATLLLSIGFISFLVMAALDVSDLSKTVEESVKVFTEALIVTGLVAALRDPALADPPEPGVYFSSL